MPRLGVLGWPVAHSRSPAMHNAALQALGMDVIGWRYQLLPVAPERFAETVRALASAGFVGANVTIPHKHAALDVSPRDMSALVLGAGGSARAVVWALREAGAHEVAVWNRTPERACALARDLGVRAVSRPAPADLLVNCTSVGLEPGGESLKQSATEPQGLNLLELTFDQVGTYSHVVDLVYRSSPTPLLAAAHARGARTVDGLEILLAQGALSFELWTGVQPPLEVMRHALRDLR